jgi:hypothetical protein
MPHRRFTAGVRVACMRRLIGAFAGKVKVRLGAEAPPAAIALH